MTTIVMDLQHLRKDIDTHVTWKWSEETPTIDNLLEEMNLTDPQYHSVDQFIKEYYLLAEQNKEIDAAFVKRIEEALVVDGRSYRRLAYHSLVPAVSLGLVTSSIEGGVAGLLAGFSIEIINQTYWRSITSPARTGWLALAGGFVGAAIDYFADMSMPFFTYIVPVSSGMFGAIVEVNKVVHRETAETIREQQLALRALGVERGDELVQKYAKRINECE